MALGLNVKALSDINVEVEVPLTPLNSESGQMRPSALIAAGEFASRVLWQRHLTPGLEELTLKSVHCRFLKPALSSIRARAEILEPERERILRKIRAGEEAEYEMPVVFIDSKDQQVTNLNCIWGLKPLRPVALGAGRMS